MTPSQRAALFLLAIRGRVAAIDNRQNAEIAAILAPTVKQCGSMPPARPSWLLKPGQGRAKKPVYTGLILFSGQEVISL